MEPSPKEAPLSKTRTIGLTTAALIACAGTASAATITQTLTFGPTLTNWAHTFSFAGFNPALGTLTKVSDTITENLAGSTVITNTGSGSATFSAHLTDVALKTFPGLTTTSTSVSTGGTGTLASGASTGVLPLTGTSSGSATTMSGLASFEATTVLADATDDGSLSLTSSTGNATAVFTDTGTVTDKLVYTYFTPEPGTLALIGTALAGFGWARRRKRR
jgi:PEP-CTERM motif